MRHKFKYVSWKTTFAHLHIEYGFCSLPFHKSCSFHITNVPNSILSFNKLNLSITSGEILYLRFIEKCLNHEVDKSFTFIGILRINRKQSRARLFFFIISDLIHYHILIIRKLIVFLVLHRITLYNVLHVMYYNVLQVMYYIIQYLISVDAFPSADCKIN